MPNFNTHWLVALAAIDKAPPYVAQGFINWKTAAEGFSKWVRYEMQNVPSWWQGYNFDDRIEDLCQEHFLDRLATDDDATCFSAYMLGACGPDFWILPESLKGMALGVGEHHFDLGHYNRTHMQFAVSVRRVAKALKARSETLQTKVETSYFVGMATHVAADLVIHQLVNRSAGAYNLLEKKWYVENSSLVSRRKTPWSTHNKVEHYWDTLVRLGAHGDLQSDYFVELRKLFKAAGFTKFPQMFPTLEQLRAEAGQHQVAEAYRLRGDSRAYGRLLATLEEESARIPLERPLNYPQLIADRLMNGSVRPFIYDVVVHKGRGAYPGFLVPRSVAGEATSGSMNRAGMGFCEVNKAEFFAKDRNDGTGLTSNNYLTYYVCPDFEQLQRTGGPALEGAPATAAREEAKQGGFYSMRALVAFLDRAAIQAGQFAQTVYGAYQARSPQALGEVRQNWNLDTGLGLQVVSRPSGTPSEVITRLDFVHVFEKGGSSVPLGPAGGADAYLKGRSEVDWMSATPKKPFPTAPADSVKDFSAVKDPPVPEGGKDRAYLDRVRLTGDPRRVVTRLGVPLGADDKKLLALENVGTDGRDKELKYFTEAESGWRQYRPAFTRSSSALNKYRMTEVAHRLTLELRVAIHDLGTDRVGFLLQGDADGIQDPNTDAAKKWLEKAQVLDRGAVEPGRPDSEGGTGSLRHFVTRILVNLEPIKDLKRKPDPPHWNNVVPYEAAKKFYGRNYAISTTRAKVLHAEPASGQFDGKADFTVYKGSSPTEQIFFTVFALVRTPEGVFDVFSKAEVNERELADMRKLDAVGFVKIVLFYALGPAGACQLAECFVDGELTKVESP